uniref:Serine/threonine-protein kinase Nek3-like n=1 Tax=Gouania willdenowi TaxID=441366 RepID=A0A8C5E6S4_GOUWI
MEGYSELKVIGEGSFGRAVLVRCKNTLQEYVVKEIQLPKNQSKSLSSRREAVLLSRMKHPHIVAFREAFEADHLLCIVMEYCRGGDLLRRIQQQKTTCFTLDDILRWFTQMCAGAMYIHDMRVLHRDLKSKNIFLTDNGTIKLGDFGSACVLNSPKAYAHTYVGTPYYVAPEIWENKPYNNKSDVWSLGCVLYELCTLRHPFQASSWKNLILKVCRGSYPPLPKHLPYELQHLLKQMFKTNPKDRPSLHTLLTCHRVSRLLRAHLPPPTTQVKPVWVSTLPSSVRQPIKYNPGSDWFFLLGRGAFRQSAKGCRSSRGRGSMSSYIVTALLNMTKIHFYKSCRLRL